MEPRDSLPQQQCRPDVSYFFTFGAPIQALPRLRTRDVAKHLLGPQPGQSWFSLEPIARLIEH